jgi:Domain of unknown function (DUF6457)
MDWLDEYARSLGVAALDEEDRRSLLKLAREVAHRSERVFAPLSTYLAGRYVAEQGEDPTTAVREALRKATDLLPPAAG